MCLQHNICTLCLIYLMSLPLRPTELLFFEQQAENEDEQEAANDDRPPFIYDVETLHVALVKAAEDPETYNPNRKKLSELEKRFKDLIPGEEGSESSDEAPELVDGMEEEVEEMEEEDEDEESARKTGWMNEFTAGDLIAKELKETKSMDKKRKDNGLL